MSLTEKAYYVTGTGMNIPGLVSTDSTTVPGAPVVGETQSLVPGAAGTTYEIPHLNIPSMVLADGPAGLRISPTRENDNATYYCTAFPVATLLASTWDTDLVYRVGQSMGNEVLEYGVAILLGPGMNIHMNPLCGRNFEYYSEDPLVTGKMAAAMVNGVESQEVGTSLKHFSANNVETNRNALNVIASERALREIYLEGFRIAVQEAQPWTVMSSYNLINNTYTAESHDLLTKILREDWGFKGLVMTDWFGGSDPVAMMMAGNDLLMPGNPNQANAILAAVKEGGLDEKVLDQNIERILTVLNESPHNKGYAYSNKPDLEAHAEVTRQAATEGMVLLKNDNDALPLTSEMNQLAAFGNTSYEIITGGTGSGDVNEAYSVSLVEGLQSAGYSIVKELQDIYSNYAETEKENLPPQQAFMPRVRVPEMAVDSDLADRMAAEADVALITIGRSSGEFSDRNVEGDFNLTQAEKALIKTISDAFHAKDKKAVVILNVGGVIETASWRNDPDAILLAWQAGQETGNSIADVISGKVNPSGKLASTFPMKYEDVPSSDNFPGVVIEAEEGSDEGGLSSFFTPKPSEIVYKEDIYVGYRYYNSFDVPVAYEFGYGLSYTQFEYKNVKINSTKFNEQLTVSVDIQNVGDVAGREVVQVYLTAPAQKMNKPAQELIAFEKTKFLNPGEIQRLEFVINPLDLTSFDEATSSWTAEAGHYTVNVGASSRDFRETTSFDLEEELIVQKVNRALTPNREINRLKP
ncbi:glycoside hydrolase family 3 C-terminal domain-containing protein [bacterium]|nr:glycoside hydrolase family 3 C-terminal domain-containing protein [bacterium]RQV93324.1 MAG: beta-glucosidase [bacterium]